MNTAIKGLMCSRALANFYLFILLFISWRIFPCKKIAFAKILVRHLRLCSVEKKLTFSSIWSSWVVRILFLKGWCWIDWVKDWSFLKGQKVEWKATLDDMIACFQKYWWNGVDGRNKTRSLVFAFLWCTIWKYCLAMLQLRD